MAHTKGSALAEPDLVPVKGGWMARSAEGSTVRVAVIGQSKDEALVRFADELAAWARLLEDEGDGDA